MVPNEALKTQRLVTVEYVSIYSIPTLYATIHVHIPFAYIDAIPYFCGRT